LHKGVTTVELWRGNVSVEILGVPAQVCAHCGAALIEIDIAERLDEIADAVITRRDKLERVVRDAFGKKSATLPTRRTLSAVPPNRLRGLKVAWQ
jgi:YgiT-type zinc finger domain-containing protein